MTRVMSRAIPLRAGGAGFMEGVKRGKLWFQRPLVLFQKNIDLPEKI